MTSVSNNSYNISNVVYELLDDLVYILDERYICEYLNYKVHQKRLGYSSIGKAFQEFVHFQDIKILNKFFSKLKEIGIANEQIRIKDELEYSFFDVKGKKFYDKSSNVKYILLLRDITEFKAIETNLYNRVEKLRDLTGTLPEIRFWNLLQTKTSKKALQRTRDMLEKVIDNIPHLLYWKDEELNYLGCNLNYALINELDSPQDIGGKTDDDLPWTRQFKSTIQDKEKKAMIKNKTQHVIETWNLPNDEKKYFEINRIPLQSIEGEVIGLLVSYYDITDRTKAEEKLRESEKKYRNIIENIQEGYFEVDLKGNYTFFNESFREMTGYSKEELLKKNYSELIDEQTKEKIFEIYNELFKTGVKKSNLRFKYYTKETKPNIVEFSVDLLYDSNGKRTGFFGLARNVTERYRLEQELKQSEAMYRLITENAYDLISIINQNLRFEYVNEGSFFSILGYSKEEMIGKSVLELVPDDGKQESLRVLTEGLKTGEGILETRIRHKNGNILWAEVKGKTFRDKDGKIKGILTGRDITERKLAEEKLRLLNQKQEIIIQEKTKELRVSEEKFRHLYEMSPYGIILLNREGEIIDCNIAMTKIFGYEREDLVGKIT